MGQARFLNDWHITARGQAGWGTVREFFRLASMERASPDAFLGDNSLVQSFSNAIHPFRRLTNSQVALFFRAEDGRIGLPVSAMMSRYYAGVHSKGSYRNGERLYRDLKAGYYEVAPRRIVEFTLYVELRSGQSEVDKAKSPLWALVTPS